MKKITLIVAMCGLCAFGYAQTQDFVSPLADNLYSEGIVELEPVEQHESTFPYSENNIMSEYVNPNSSRTFTLLGGRRLYIQIGVDYLGTPPPGGTYIQVNGMGLYGTQYTQVFYSNQNILYSANIVWDSGFVNPPPGSESMEWGFTVKTQSYGVYVSAY